MNPLSLVEDVLPVVEPISVDVFSLKVQFASVPPLTIQNWDDHQSGGASIDKEHDQQKQEVEAMFAEV